MLRWLKLVRQALDAPPQAGPPDWQASLQVVFATLQEDMSTTAADSGPRSANPEPQLQPASQQLPCQKAMRPSTRQEKARYQYPATDEAAFVELEDESLGGETFSNILQQVPGVEEVQWQTAKRDQGNPGNRALGVSYDGNAIS